MMTDRRRWMPVLLLCAATCSAAVAAEAWAQDNEESVAEAPQKKEKRPPPPPSPFVPRYRAYFKDGRRLKEGINKNDWLKELYQTSLYHGLMLRLSPVLFTLGENHERAWSGKLIDYAYDKLLQDRPISVSYFGRPNLSSPFGITIHDLGGAEKSVIKAVLKGMKAGEPVQVEVVAPSREKQSVAVTPIRMGTQKFAMVQHGDCLSLSREAKVAAALSFKCESVKSGQDDAWVSVDLKEFFPPLYPMLSKFVGIKRDARISLEWDSSEKAFRPSRMELGLEENHLLTSVSPGADLAKILPAAAPLVAVAALPAPQSISRVEVEALLKTERKDIHAMKTKALALAFLGMREVKFGDRKALVSLTAVLVPQDKVDEKTLADLDGLFSEKELHEMKFKHVCGTHLAFSDRIETIELLEKACGRQIPSFKDLPEKLIKPLLEASVSGGLFVNLGGFLADSVALGWQLEPSEKGSAPMPKDVEKARELLGKLPLFSFAGASSGKTLVLNGVSQ